MRLPHLLRSVLGKTSQVPILLHDSLEGKKRVFKPIKRGVVTIYNCGPTVYDRSHIGNLRSYVFADILRRTLEYNGYNVKQITNITDVGHLSGENAGNADQGEDKMSKALKREGLPLSLKSMKQVADKYEQIFVADLDKLNIKSAYKYPRASEHISQDIEIVEKLLASGHAYRITDGIYFDVSKFPKYGKLGNISVSGQKDGARVAVNQEKRNSADFALWKFDNRLGWDAPWGKGFPGWHIECSAMSREYLGQPFDIHTGGIDHIPVHHNNEIAQSEAAYGKPLAHYWMHNEFLNFRGGKMSKSLGTFITLDTLSEKNISPLSYRYLLLTAHYRSPISYSDEAILASQNAYLRLRKFFSAMSTAISPNDNKSPSAGTKSEKYINEFHLAINDDLDTPSIIALLWKLSKDDSLIDEDKTATVIEMDRVLGLDLLEPIEANQTDGDVPDEVRVLAKQRDEARANKDFDQSDILRDKIAEHGYKVIDTPQGFKLEKL